MEYTKIDALIDVIFTTAKDVESAAQTESPETDEDEHIEKEKEKKSAWEFTDSSTLQAKRDTIVSAFSKREKISLIKRSRAMYWDPNHQTRIICTISKRYTKKGSYPYWYAYHPQWDSFLAEGKKSYFVLGCMDLDIAFTIPYNILHSNLDKLSVTSDPELNQMYWHIKIVEPTVGKYAIQLPKVLGSLSINDFIIHL